MSEEDTRGAPDHVVDFHDPRIDKAYWYPRLRDADVPTPETLRISLERNGDGLPTWDTEEVCSVVEDLGGEAFVRSGYKSGQMALHQGSHITEPTPEDVDVTLTELVSQHAMMAMPVGKALWASEWLDLNFCAYARDNLVPEVRVFIRDGDVACHHPRLEGFGDHEDHRETAEEYIESSWDGEHREETLQDYATRVADAFDGDGWWSVDFVMNRGGQWWCTDMALDGLHYREDKGWLNVSEHQDGCDNNLEETYGDSLEPPEEVSSDV